MTGGSQADGGNRGSGAKAGFVVGMPAHGVAAVAIEIEQHGIERCGQVLLNKGFDGKYNGVPWMGLKFVA